MTGKSQCQPFLAGRRTRASVPSAHMNERQVQGSRKIGVSDRDWVAAALGKAAALDHLETFSVVNI